MKISFKLNFLLDTETNITKLYRVGGIIKHPLYSNVRRDYDIAIITTAGLIEFTNEVGPACLPFQHHMDSFGGMAVDVLGKFYFYNDKNENYILFLNLEEKILPTKCGLHYQVSIYTILWVMHTLGTIRKSFL